MAAAQLGYRVHIYAPDEAPAGGRGRRRASPAAPIDDAAALARFAAAVDVVTYEFENIPAGRARRAGRDAPLRPPRRALEIAQDRLAEKSSSRRSAARPRRFAAVDSRAELHAAVARDRPARDPEDPPLRL